MPKLESALTAPVVLAALVLGAMLVSSLTTPAPPQEPAVAVAHK